MAIAFAIVMYPKVLVAIVIVIVVTAIVIAIVVIECVMKDGNRCLVR